MNDIRQTVKNINAVTAVCPADITFPWKCRHLCEMSSWHLYLFSWTLIQRRAVMRMSQLHVRLTCAVRLYVGFPGDVRQSALIQLSLCGFRYPLLLKLCRTLRRGHFYSNSWNIPSEIQTRKRFPVFSSRVFELTLDANAFIVYIRQMSHSEVPTVILSDYGSALFPTGCRIPTARC